MVVNVDGKFDIDFEVSGAAGREPRVWVMTKENGELKVEKATGSTVDIWRWQILPSAVQDFLALPEETEICHLSDPTSGVEKTYRKSDIYHVIVVSEFGESFRPSSKVFLNMAELMPEDTETENKMPPLSALLHRYHPRWGLRWKDMLLSSAYLSRPKTDGELANFTLNFGLVTSCDPKRQLLAEAIYPDAFQRALFKLGGLLEPDINGFVPKYFVGCQSGRLYHISVMGVGLSATVLEDDLDIRKTGRLDGLRVVDGVGSRGSLPLDALKGTDYLKNAIDDVDGLVHLAFVERNPDLLNGARLILTKEELVAMAEVYY